MEGLAQIIFVVCLQARRRTPGATARLLVLLTPNPFPQPRRQYLLEPKQAREYGKLPLVEAHLLSEGYPH